MPDHSFNPSDEIVQVPCTAAEAALALKQRREARKSLDMWCRYCGFVPATHHRLLNRRLEAMARGECDRLIVLMPPGYAKSTYASVLFPAWYLSWFANHSLIAASHTAELAEKWGRRVRNIVAEHANVLGYGLSEDSQAAGRWETDKGGEYFAAGIGGAVAGRRGDFIVIDDPVRSREDAESATVRDKTWDWYKSDLYTRLKPGGRIVLIQTRWHELDLAGRLLLDMENGGDRWEVICLPALAEADDPLGRSVGEPLWPEWEDREQLERKQRAIGPRDWASLFQQRPAPEDGNYFKKDWLKPYYVVPDVRTLRIYGASDYAVTADGGDYTVHVIVGMDPTGALYLLDMWRKQTASDEWVEAFCDLVIRWKPMGWAEERGQIRSGVGPYLERRQGERRAFVARDSFPTRGDKAVRAQSIRGRMALGGLYVPVHADWYSGFQGELLSFPAGKHDDQVDALGLIGQLLDLMLPGAEVPKPAANENRQDYRPKPLQAAGDWVTY